MRTQVFDDFDAFAQSVRGVDSRMLLRNPRNRVWSTYGIDLGKIDVQLGQLGSGNIAQGELRSDGFMVYLPLSKGVQYSANGEELSENSVAVLEPGCEFCISTKVEHDWCAAFVPTEMLGSGHAFEYDLGRTCRVAKPEPTVLAKLQTVLHGVVHAAAESNFEQSAAATQAQTAILDLASQIVTGRQSNQSNAIGRSRLSRRKIIRLAMERIEQHAGQPIGVAELAQSAAVSERTLRNAFNDYFGVGPVRYLQLQHLHRIHRALKAADRDEMTVSRVLVDHGEFAFSRFAARYRKLFGEYPAETLRRNA